jgi:hypothetical protein
MGSDDRGDLLLAATTERSLQIAELEPERIIRFAPGYDTRYGPDNVAEAHVAFVRRLLSGERFSRLSEVQRALHGDGIPKRLTATLFAQRDDPRGLGLGGAASAYAMTAAAYRGGLPVRPQVITVAGPSFSFSGVHVKVSGVRTQAFGLDGQKVAMIYGVYLGATYDGLQSGYSVAVCGLIRPSRFDTIASASKAGRALSFTDPNAALAAHLRAVRVELDAARPPDAEEPAWLITEGRNDQWPTNGFSIESTGASIVERRGWGRTFAEALRGALVLIEAGELKRPGGGGFHAACVYRATDGTEFRGNELEVAAREQHPALMRDVEFCWEDLAGAVDVSLLGGEGRDRRTGERFTVVATSGPRRSCSSRSRGTVTSGPRSAKLSGPRSSWRCGTSSAAAHTPGSAGATSTGRATI